MQSALGGNLLLNQNLQIGQVAQQVGPYDKVIGMQPGQHYIEQAQADYNLTQQINQISSAASLNFKAKNNYSLKVQLS